MRVSTPTTANPRSTCPNRAQISVCVESGKAQQSNFKAKGGPYCRKVITHPLVPKRWRQVCVGWGVCTLYGASQKSRRQKSGWTCPQFRRSVIRSSSGGATLASPTLPLKTLVPYRGQTLCTLRGKSVSSAKPPPRWRGKQGTTPSNGLEANRVAREKSWRGKKYWRSRLGHPPKTPRLPWISTLPTTSAVSL